MRTRLLLTVESFDERAYVELVSMIELPYVPDVCEEIDGLLGYEAERLYLSGKLAKHTTLVVSRRLYRHDRRRLDLSFEIFRLGPDADLAEVVSVLRRAGWVDPGAEEPVGGVLIEGTTSLL